MVALQYGIVLYHHGQLFRIRSDAGATIPFRMSPSRGRQSASVGHPQVPSGGFTESAGDLDVRVRHSKEVIMATTYELLSEEGLAGVTVDAVARRSGVAKTTIYRHWPSREALLLDACAQMGPHFDVPNAGSLSKDLHALAERVVEQLLAGP